ncbi:deoxynucleoside triphosphate triphosphohydrolase SAMHD1-like isoform X2 [Phyllobates terribilis]|uniref:deoxynucleoside triphosphate triphosphohydrolase SAMHD1-like isoform X2 n=1 Tax=Phyllobates terribilis TaxID=111132 RepID=UPI003CCB4B5D
MRNQQSVAYLAGCLVKELQKRQPELNIDERDILCVQIAGLCHDLGHGPFSHLFEKRFMLRAASDKKFEHVEISEKMLDHLIESNNLEEVMKKYKLVLEKNVDLIFIKELITGQPKDKGNQNNKEWSYLGRGKDKSFLYEIVANQKNGMDVDKMDYFARDCYHLGMRNSFDHKRFLALARVCEDEDGKHICIRDKEFWNVYDFFYTRYSLHQRACQHKIGNSIEIMITDALLKADSHIKIKGSDGNSYTISGSVDDMVAYTKLTDCIFQQILHDELPGSQILSKLERRKLYVFLGKTKPTAHTEITKKDREKMEDELAEFSSEKLTAEDFRVDPVSMDYGQKEKNPVENVRFYLKSDLNKAVKIEKSEVSRILPTNFQEQILRVYCTKTDKKSVEAAKDCFEKWRRNREED